MRRYLLRYEVPVPLKLLTGAEVIEMQPVHTTVHEADDKAASEWALRYLKRYGITRDKAYSARLVALTHVMQHERVVMQAA